MRYLVLSDTHGSFQRAFKAYEQAAKSGPVDGILHLGDGAKEAEDLAYAAEKPVTRVLGNCDGNFNPEGYKIVETPWGNIFMAHGHMESVNAGDDELMGKALNLGCRAAFYGHTHVPDYTVKTGNFIVLNPGSIGKPMGGRKPSYAIVEILPMSPEQLAARPASANNDLCHNGYEFRASILTLDESVTGGSADRGGNEHFAVQAGFRR